MTIKPTQGPGAAHIGWSMFGARGPLLQVAPASGGGGAGAGGGTPSGTQQPAPATPAAPAQPQQPTTPAQGTAPQLDDAVVKAIEERTRNSIFAELRRNGALKKSAIEAMEGRSTPAAGQQPGTQAAVDPSALRSLDRAISKLALGDKLSDAQWRRAERDFLADKPSDPVAWLKDYFPGVGTPPAAPAGSTQQQNATGQPASPQNQQPASGAAGAPARGNVPLDQVNPLTMSPEDIAHHVARVGPSAFKAQLTQALRGVRIKITPD